MGETHKLTGLKRWVTAQDFQGTLYEYLIGRAPHEAPEAKVV